MQHDDDKHKTNDKSSQSSGTPHEPDDEAVKADPVKRQKPERNEPGKRLEDYTG
jgi:hypothetical protein